MNVERLVQAALTAAEKQGQQTQLDVIKQARLRNAQDAITEVDSQIAKITTWIDQLTAWRQTFCEQLLACPPYQRGRAAMNREEALKLSIRCIDFGAESHGYLVVLGQNLADEMRAAGYAPAEGELSVWSGGYGSLPQARERLARLQVRRAEAQAILDEQV